MKPKTFIPRSIVVICFMLFVQFINAQVRTKIFRDGIPGELLPTNRLIDKMISLNPPRDFTDLKNSKKSDNDNRFATSLFMSIDFIANAIIKTDNEFKIYSLKLNAKEALNISIEFDRFFLLENSVLSIYTNKELTDSITFLQNNHNNIWATRVYQGNYLNIVLKERINQKETSRIRISKVNFGYKSFGMEFGNPGASASCNVNIACPIGNSWGEERNSVALIVANGSEACTGALVMNTCNTDIPYFLTANHCLQAGNVNNWVFQFQYWSNTCSGNNGMNEDVQFNGCQLRANSGTTDFALLELNQTPSSGSGIRYAGWSRQTGFIQNTTILHHPKGDVMKISIDNQPPIPQFIFGIQCWRLGIDVGATEGGSSGSPYFNQNHRIIGQHYGVTDVSIPTCSNNVKIGGRFDLSWTGGGTNTTRLSNWLDPTNTGATTTTTTNISALTTHNLNLSIDGNWFVCPNSSTTYTLNGAPGGLNINWAISNPTIASLTSSGNQATVTYLADGNVTLTATVGNSSCLSNNVATRYLELGEKTLTDIIGLNPPLGVSPGELLELSVGALPNTPVEWTVEGGTILGNSTSPNVLIQVDQCSPYIENGYINVHCTFTHTCGTGTYTEWTTVVCGTGGGPARAIPNPANDNTTIEIQGSGKMIKEIKVTDKMGNVVKQIRFRGVNKKETIDVSSLPSDIYYVQVFDGKTWIGIHLSVRH